MPFIRIILFSFLLLLPGVRAHGQVTVPTDEELAKGTDEQKIEAAEYFFEKKMYRQSLRIWKHLLKDYPDNPRINYMAGKSQLLSGKDKARSIGYFEKTLDHVSNKLTFDSRRMEEVPADALFCMGQACHLNHRFDEAVGYYQKFVARIGPKMPEELKKEVDRWTQWSNNAKTMMAKENKAVQITNLGPQINTADEEYSPVLSLDQAVIYFTSRRMRPDSSNRDVIMPETGQFYEDVYLSFLEENGSWSKPKLMNFGNEPDDNEATVSVSADGTEVYVYVDKEGGGDLYNASFLEGGFNAELEHMPGEINSPSWETHCTITPDGQTMFFTSNRPGGIGGLDIYRVVRLPNQQWSKATILPPPINTPYDEDAPFIHPSGNILYYSSNSPASMGGCDVFYSRIIEPNPLVFSDPKNMGSPVNTPDDDVFFVMDASGSVGYYSSDQNGGYGGHDIFKITFVNSEIKESFAILKGKVKTTDNSPVPDNIVVNVANQTQNDEPLRFKPRAVDGRFVMALKPCNEYEVVYNRGNEPLRSEIVKVPCDLEYEEYNTILELDSMLLPVDRNVAVNDNSDSGNNNVSGKGVSDEPVIYEKYFDYNVKAVPAEQAFASMIERVVQRIGQNGRVEVTIEASASHVPTATFGTNNKLSQARAAEMRNQLEEALRVKGIDTSKVKFKSINALVQGPRYRNDYEKNRNEYGKYQYVRIWIR